MISVTIAIASMTILQGGMNRMTTQPPIKFGAVPSTNQMNWQKMEFYAFVHFGVNTFTDREWGEGTEDPKIFNPTQLDCKQWVKAFKDAGMKGVILTAKHHDGFCLWPSKYTEHSVKNSPWLNGKGDVVGDLSKACKEAGLKLGLYLSPWDRHEPTYGDSPKYNEHYIAQLTELLSNYGPLFEVWWDGACGEGPNGKKQVYDWSAYKKVVRKLQPKTVIFSDVGDVRWVGNEDGYANETNWSTFSPGKLQPGQSNPNQTFGNEDGSRWAPAECDVSIRPGWFYHASQDQQVKSLDTLWDIYMGSVGRNASMLLNVPADRRGLIQENDFSRLKEFRAELDKVFKKDLAKGAKVTSDSTRGGDSLYGPQNLVDGNDKTYWATDDGITRGLVTIELAKPTRIGFVSLAEFIRLGQRVVKFEIEVWKDGAWSNAAYGTTIGYRRIVPISPVTTNKVRVRILESKACPVLDSIGLFRPRTD